MCEGLNGISDRKPPGIGKIGSNPAFCLSQSAISRMFGEMMSNYKCRKIRVT